MENQSTPTVFESVAVAVVIVMYFCLGMYGYLLLAHCGFLIYSAWALFQKPPISPARAVKKPPAGFFCLRNGRFSPAKRFFS